MPSDFSLLSHVASLVNEGFYWDGGCVRGMPVAIGGTSYVPPLPQETVIRERLSSILAGEGQPIDKAIELCISCMKWQVFMDGNKRASVIYANHYLIAQGSGLLVVPKRLVPEFKALLVAYYEGAGANDSASFMKENCWRRIGD